jgi:hypothetical protein
MVGQTRTPLINSPLHNIAAASPQLAVKFVPRVTIAFSVELFHFRDPPESDHAIRRRIRPEHHVPNIARSFSPDVSSTF